MKKSIVSLVVLALLVLGGMWLYGFCGVKLGWVGPTEIPGLNSISKRGAQAAGGITEAMKVKAESTKDAVMDSLGL